MDEAKKKVCERNLNLLQTFSALLMETTVVKALSPSRWTRSAFHFNRRDSKDHFHEFIFENINGIVTLSANRRQLHHGEAASSRISD